jgi:hypothetical protein
MTPEIAHRQQIERTIGKLIVENAINKGYSITVFDGEEEAITKSREAAAILNSMMATDEEHLLFYKPEETYVGFVFLVYGNDGWDAIADYIDEPEIKDILAHAEHFAFFAEINFSLEAEKKAQQPEEHIDDWGDKGSHHHY